MDQLNKELHIICLDVPYPVDYGGVFDLFYKVKALYEAGIKIHLHCFEYGRPRQDELNKYCANVLYYKRLEGIKGFSFRLPYIVNSRRSDELTRNLLHDSHPILLEGIHCSYILTDERFRNRKIILRLHNVEYIYYSELLKTASSIIKRVYYAYESKLLFRYERSIARKVTIAAVSKQDSMVYRTRFLANKIFHLPVFVPYTQISAREGLGCYCLYHANLSVAENEKAAMWLLKSVFDDLEMPFVIAGKSPSRYLKAAIAKRPHTCLVVNPDDDEMQDLISKAQVHVLPSFNKTGIKLKLLNALFNGRHCVVNEAAIEGTALENTCHVGRTPAEIKSIIRRLYHQPFSDADSTRRKLVLEGTYENSNNAKMLIQSIW